MEGLGLALHDDNFYFDLFPLYVPVSLPRVHERSQTTDEKTGQTLPRRGI